MKTFTIGETWYGFSTRTCTHNVNTIADKLFEHTSAITYHNLFAPYPTGLGAANKLARIIVELEDAVNAKSDLAKVICIDRRGTVDTVALNPAKYAKELERYQTINVKLSTGASAERCDSEDQRLWLLTLRWEKNNRGKDRPLMVLQAVEIKA